MIMMIPSPLSSGEEEGGMVDHYWRITYDYYRILWDYAAGGFWSQTLWVVGACALWVLRAFGSWCGR